MDINQRLKQRRMKIELQKKHIKNKLFKRLTKEKKEDFSSKTEKNESFLEKIDKFQRRFTKINENSMNPMKKRTKIKKTKGKSLFLNRRSKVNK